MFLCFYFADKELFNLAKNIIILKYFYLALRNKNCYIMLYLQYFKNIYKSYHLFINKDEL
jgi:hypothetical protein